MKPGDYGLICAFGAGYSIGGALVRMMSAQRSSTTLLAGREACRCGIFRASPHKDHPCSTSSRLPTTSKSCRSASSTAGSPGPLRHGARISSRSRRCAAARLRGDRERHPCRPCQALQQPRAVVSARHRTAQRAAIVDRRIRRTRHHCGAHGHSRDQSGVDRRQSCPRRRAAAVDAAFRHAAVLRGGVTIKVDAQNGPCRITGKSIAEHAGMADVTAGALLFPKVAKRLRGLVAWVEKARHHHAGRGSVGAGARAVGVSGMRGVLPALLRC